MQNCTKQVISHVLLTTFAIHLLVPSAQYIDNFRYCTILV